MDYRQFDDWKLGLNYKRNIELDKKKVWDNDFAIFPRVSEIFFK